jgi:hypothetical protein
MASIVEFSRLSAILTLDITKFLRNSELAQNKLQKLSASFRGIGSTLSRGVSIGFGLVAAGAIATAAEFDRISFQLEAIAGNSAIKTLTDNAKELGIATAFTATEIQKFQLEIARLGRSSEEIIGLSKGVTSLATIFDLDLADTGQQISQVLNQFNLGFDQASRVSDVFATATKSSQLTVTDLTASLKNVGPIAATLGFSLEETVAIMGTFADSGTKGGIAGTKFKSALNSLVKKFPEAKKQFRSLVFGQAEYNEILDQTNSRGAILPKVLQDQKEGFVELLNELNNATGATEELSEGLEDRLFYSVELIKNSVQGVGIALGEAFGPQLKSIASTLSGLAASIGDASSGSTRFAAQLITIGVVAGPALFALSLLVDGFIALSSPIGAAIAALTILAGAFLKARIEAEILAANSKSADESFSDLAVDVSDAVDGIKIQGRSVKDIVELQEKASAAIRKQNEAIKDQEALLAKANAAMVSAEDLANTANRQVDNTQAIEDREAALARIAILQDRIRGLDILQLDLDGEAAALRAKEEESLRTQLELEMEAQTQKGKQLALDKEAEKLLEKRIKLANELADAFARNQDPNFGAFSANESTENLIGLINNLSDLGVTLRDAQAEADKIFGQKGLLSRSNLEDNTEAAREQAEEYEEFDALLTRFEPIVKGIGRGFADAILGIKGFGQALKDSLIRALDAVITKVISLIALYAILFALSGGPSGTTGSLGAFLKAGFGGGDFNAVAFDTFSFLGGGRSATGGGGGSRQGFRLQGKDLVLSTQRSGRSLTRIG